MEGKILYKRENSIRKDSKMFKIFKKFKALETAKKLITVVTLTWMLSIIIGFIGILFSFDFIPIITIVNIDFLVILGYYFTKAGVENVSKGKIQQDAWNESDLEGMSEGIPEDMLKGD